MCNTPVGLGANRGHVLGVGAPYYRYTVGQRRGLGLSSSSRLFVLGVDPTHNRVRVGKRQQLMVSGVDGERLHWIGRQDRGAVEATVRIRSRHPGVAAQIVPGPAGTVRVEFESPQVGVAPGQAAVFYQGSRVLGGCWIAAAIPNVVAR